MKQYAKLSPGETITILRSQLEEAYDRGCLPVIRELSRRMDEIQLRHWQAQLSRAS